MTTHLMTPTPWRTRFAPSPTGTMHLGNARTAILNWLMARKHQGSFSVRLEDTDRERSTFASEASILSSLAWMHLEPDHPVIRQSTRLERYRNMARTLMDKGLAYPCFCTEAELHKDREMAAAKGLPPRYTGKCAGLSPQEISKKMDQGLAYTIRFRVDQSMPDIQFNDLIKGSMHIPVQAFGDFVILRSNGWPSYNFAVVVDDQDMDITLVLRGEDHLTNTARQILLYKALDMVPPQFAHHGLLVDKNQRKLSKRTGAKSIPQLMDAGIHPLALVHYLAGLSGAVKGKKIVGSLDELVDRFNPMRLGRGNAVFLMQELEQLSKTYWHKLDPENILPHLQGLACLEPSWTRLSARRQNALIATVQPNAGCSHDFVPMLMPLLRLQAWYTPQAIQLLQRQPNGHIIQTFLDLVLEYTALSHHPADSPLPLDEVARILKETSTRAKVTGKALYLPLRMGLMGTSQGPEIKQLFTVLSSEQVIRRMQDACTLAGTTNRT
jgi:glutamyl-tRNA synthetase/nondiscriminating glutamyl-tRNA synthetase